MCMKGLVAGQNVIDPEGEMKVTDPDDLDGTGDTNPDVL